MQGRELRQALHSCPEVDGQRLHGERVREVEHKWGRWQVNISRHGAQSAANGACWAGRAERGVLSEAC